MTKHHPYPAFLFQLLLLPLLVSLNLGCPQAASAEGAAAPSPAPTFITPQAPLVRPTQGFSATTQPIGPPSDRFAPQDPAAPEANPPPATAKVPPLCGALSEDNVGNGYAITANEQQWPPDTKSEAYRASSAKFEAMWKQKIEAISSKARMNTATKVYLDKFWSFGFSESKGITIRACILKRAVKQEFGPALEKAKSKVDAGKGAQEAAKDVYHKGIRAYETLENELAKSLAGKKQSAGENFQPGLAVLYKEIVKDCKSLYGETDPAAAECKQLVGNPSEKQFADPASLLGNHYWQVLKELKEIRRSKAVFQDAVAKTEKNSRKSGSAKTSAADGKGRKGAAAPRRKGPNDSDVTLDEGKKKGKGGKDRPLPPPRPRLDDLTQGPEKPPGAETDPTGTFEDKGKKRQIGPPYDPALDGPDPAIPPPGNEFLPPGPVSHQPLKDTSSGMTQFVKDNWVWMAGGAAVGVGGYMYYRHEKNKAKQEAFMADDTNWMPYMPRNNAAQAVVNGGSGGSTTPPPGGNYAPPGSRLIIEEAITGAAVGQVMAPIHVRIVDPNGMPLSTTGVQIEVSCYVPQPCSLTGGKSVTSVNGGVTFSGIYFVQPDQGVRLQFNAVGFAAVTMPNTFNVTGSSPRQ